MATEQVDVQFRQYVIRYKGFHFSWNSRFLRDDFSSATRPIPALLCYIVHNTKHCMPFHIYGLRRERSDRGAKGSKWQLFSLFLFNFHPLMTMFGYEVYPNYTQVTTKYEEPTRPSARGIFSRKLNWLHCSIKIFCWWTFSGAFFNIFFVLVVVVPNSWTVYCGGISPDWHA